MDSRSFDRLARLMGEATDRRAGLKAALGLLLGGAAADASAKARNRDDRGGNRRDRSDADSSAADADDAKKKRRCKAIGGRCKKQKHCCAGTCVKPTNNKGKPAKKGICLCVNEGGACLSTADCCIVGSAGIECRSGVCTRVPVATGHACVEGDACADPDAACTVYRRDDGARTSATLCLIGGGGACVKDQDCISLECAGGTCTGEKLQPLGDPCDPAAPFCADSRATCRAYDAGSGGPAGPHCVLPRGAACERDPQCANYDCITRTCGRTPVATGAACDAGVDTCADPRARCERFDRGNDQQTYCLLGIGDPCGRDGDCRTGDCKNGVCAGQRREVPTGGACDPQADLCIDPAAECTGYAADPDGPTHCLLDNGAVCEANADCRSGECRDLACAGRRVPILTGDDCDPAADTCEASPEASCTVYASGDEITRCLVADGGACAQASDCVSLYCDGGACATEAQPVCDVCPSGCEFATIAGAIAAKVAAGQPIDLKILGGDAQSAWYAERDLVVKGWTMTLSRCDHRMVTIWPQEAGRAMVLQPGSDVTLVGIRVYQGKTIGGGGGISVDPGATLTMIDSAVEGCTSTSRHGFGGGIFSRGKLEIRGSRFSGNSAEFGGGFATKDGGQTVIRDSEFVGNTCRGGSGGAMSLDGPTHAERIVVRSNVSGGGGGGVHINGEAPLTASDFQIIDNRAEGGYGGGIQNYANDEPMILSNGTISGNLGDYGGGGLMANGPTTLVNVSVTNNTVPFWYASGGGGIMLPSWDGVLNLLGTTVVSGNFSAVGGSGVLIQRTSRVVCGESASICGNGPAEATENCVGGENGFSECNACAPDPDGICAAS